MYQRGPKWETNFRYTNFFSRLELPAQIREGNSKLAKQRGMEVIYHTKQWPGTQQWNKK